MEYAFTKMARFVNLFLSLGNLCNFMLRVSKSLCIGYISVQETSVICLFKKFEEINALVVFKRIICFYFNQ